jgi:putative endonuclease
MKKDEWQNGRTGEEAAVTYLEALGYRILERNYRSRRGEIDIIGQDGDTLVFIEVKTRAADAFGYAESAVNRKKQQKISSVSLHYLQARRLFDRPARFDVVTVRRAAQGYDIRLIKDAFDLIL